MDRVPCKKCGAKALSSTIGKTNGYCMPCFKGRNKKSVLQRVEDKAIRMGLMKESDRTAHLNITETEGENSLDHPKSKLPPARYLEYIQLSCQFIVQLA